MNQPIAKRVSYDIGCMKSLRKLPDKVSLRFMDMMTRYMSAPESNGLNLETVEGSKDSSIKSLRVDQGYRAIAFELGRDIMFVHVGEHDKAYRWATGRRVKLDPATNRVRIIQEIDAETETQTAAAQLGLFDGFADKKLRALGIPDEELPAIRKITSFEELETDEDKFDPLSYQVLYALAAGYSEEEVYAMTGVVEGGTEEANQGDGDVSFDKLIETDESRQTIFIPESEAELRRVFEEGLEGWRVFLHPEQRKLAYRDYNGPAMVRGGAGTGKTVVAMHRAKHLADQIAADPRRVGEKVLFTTFTTSLVQDILNNLRTLCPEHLDSKPARIEVINLDRWVSQFLRRKDFGRQVAYSSEARNQLEEIWGEVFEVHELPENLNEDFAKAEWVQVVQAKGLTDKRAYLKVSRAGRGTSLDRRKRATLWDIFSDYRARVVSAGLAEADDAYREAAELLLSEAPNLPYAAVVVDEAQDMGEQAFKLIRAIVPEKTTGDKNTIFIVGDAHQRIYARRASMSACGINIRGRSRRLRLNYRTTQEIRAWAVSILEGVSVDDLDEGTDTLKGYVSLLKGPNPELSSYPSEIEELTGLADWVSKVISSGTAPEDIGILCNRRKDIARVEDALHRIEVQTLELKAGEADSRDKPGVRITTMHRAKGLEFFAVAIPFMSKSAFPPKIAIESAVDDADLHDIINQYRSLLHVAATRAKKELRVSWSGEVTDLAVVGPSE
ncbi:ATP-dependent helicase [Ruegeria sp. HU-ET01832]|uniref:UvrD-helicase domain-containing protein n=1 Tax=Ruegeria sp. HU-ET01832 TaxID=3135906 RepID=UPI003107B9D4